MDNYYERLNQAFANWNGGEPSLDDRVAALESEMLQKQDILTFDSEPVEDSENPVTSGGLFSRFERYATKIDLNDKVDTSIFTADQDRQDALELEDRAALVQQVDGGAKNVANFTFGGVVQNVNVKPGTIVCTENGGVFDFSGTSDDKNYAAYILKQCKVKAGKYIVSGINAGGNTTYWIRFGSGTDDAFLFNLYDGTREVNFTSDTLLTVQFVIYANQTVSSIIVTPMICTAADYKISQTFVPYRPSWQEMWDMIQALQSGS